jgi:hypothetical protein
MLVSRAVRAYFSDVPAPPDPPSRPNEG